MPRQSTPRRPPPVHVGLLRAYPRRAPTDTDPRWYWQVVQHQDDGQQSIPGASGRYTVAEVMQRLASLVAEHGYDVPTERPAPAPVTTVGELLRAWLAEQRPRVDRKRLAPSSYVAYLGSVRAWITEAGDDPLALLRERAQVQGHLDSLSKRYAPRTVAHILTTLQIAWRWGLEEEIVPGPLPRRLETPRVDRDERVYRSYTPTPAEVWQVLPALREPWQRLAVVLLRTTGARAGEIAQLTWDRISLERAEVTLQGKTGRRAAPLPAWVVAALVAWEPDPAHRTGRLMPVSVPTVAQQLSARIVGACRRAGIEPWTAHALRRLRSWELIANETNPATYEALMGHSLEEGLRSYARATPEARAAAAASLPPPPGMPLLRGPVQ